MPMLRLQTLGTNLGEKDRDAEADGNADQHGDEGGEQRAVDGRQRAEFLGDRIPAFRGEETETEGAPGRQGAVQQRDHDTGKQHEHGNCRSQGDDFENLVVAAEAAQSLGEFGFVVDEREMSLRDGCACHLVYP